MLSASVLLVVGLVAATIVSAQPAFAQASADRQEQPRTGRGRGGTGQAQAQQQDRTPIPGGRGSEPSPLLFHEAWTRAPLAQPMVQENLGNQHLTTSVKRGIRSRARGSSATTCSVTCTGVT